VIISGVPGGVRTETRSMERAFLSRCLSWAASGPPESRLARGRFAAPVWSAARFVQPITNGNRTPARLARSTTAPPMLP